ncbi:MAG: preprotein translocase subunit SecG [Gammaproteobacteria bacterium]
MQSLLVVIHVLIAVALMALVLIQQGKGASVGAAFGSGASNTVFGARGAMPFLFKLTAFLAAGFFISSILLGYMASVQGKHRNDLGFTLGEPVKEKK